MWPRTVFGQIPLDRWSAGHGQPLNEGAPDHIPGGDGAMATQSAGTGRDYRALGANLIDAGGRNTHHQLGVAVGHYRADEGAVNFEPPLIVGAQVNFTSVPSRLRLTQREA